MNARQLALSCLVRVYKEGGYSNIVIDKQLAGAQLDARDKAFASALFYGVLERKITIDYALQPHCSQKLKKLTPPVLGALELGLYQLIYMAHLPQSAVVNESVDIVKKAGQPRASGLVNGVLRSFIRKGCKINLPQKPLSLRMSIEYSVTEELARLLLDTYGEEKTVKFLSASCGKPPVYLRVNTLKTDVQKLIAQLEEEGVSAEEHPKIPNCLKAEGIGDLRRLKSFADGLFHVQDAASQLCALCLDARPGMTVGDLCAAPGGKSFTIAQHMENTGTLYAYDLHQSRVGLIADGAKRLGCTCIKAEQGDALEPQGKPKEYDRVLCDVPCSGYGIIRRKPEIRLKPLSEVEELPEMQLNILRNGAKCLKKDGLLIYSTCTLNPVENFAVVQKFLDGNADFEWAALPELAGGKGYITLTGDEFDSDGFFISAIRRVN